ncbi:MAG: hemerythrin domain-containing protein, partial [Ignavibacteriaceae bacterium]
TLEGKKEYTISFYKTDLEKHFEDEEKILFPSVIKRNDEADRLIEEVVLEHRKIELLINDLIKKSDVEDLMDELGVLLENHIRKEERKLFPKIEEILSAEELLIIGEQISSSRNKINK